MFRRRKVQYVDQPTADDLTGIDRRRMLRLGGMAAAGAAGATVAGAASAGTAGAADGGTMILGRANDSGLKDTRLTAQSYKSALSVTNTGIGPAVGATGRPIAVGGSVAAAGHGAALDVQGVATFSRSGVVEITIANGNRVEVTVPGGLKASSRVFAMAQQASYNGGTRITVEAAEPNVTTGKITIWFNANLGETGSLKVAWFVIG